MKLKVFLFTLLLTPIILIAIYILINGASLIEAKYNPVIKQPPYVYSDSARDLSKKLFIADLHNDLLMFNRDILEKSEVGHTDIPRLLEGYVSLQTFSAPTMLPSSWNDDPYSNSIGFDLFVPLSISQFYPIKAWFNPLNRAIHMSEKLHEAEKRSNSTVSIITSKKALENFYTNNSNDKVAAILSIEGLHVINGNVENIDSLFNHGYRMMGIAHFHDNKVGGSCSGNKRHGLTNVGRDAITLMEEKGIVIDLAHASHQVYKDVFELSSTPLVVSHTGVQGINSIDRNMTDEEIIKVAESGGVIGVGFWDAAIKDPSAKGIVETIQYIKNIVGVDHIGLGSDYDGSIRAPFTASGIPLIIEELLKNDFTEEEIAKIMGGNILRVYRSVLK